jgi:hypothetical protein
MSYRDHNPNPLSCPSSLDHFFDLLWAEYAALTPQASLLREGLLSRGESKIVNDHIALRTWGAFKGYIGGLETYDPLFIQWGYIKQQEYVFESKKLKAYSYQHPNPHIPKIFISEIEIQCLSNQAQACIDRLWKSDTQWQDQTQSDLEIFPFLHRRFNQTPTYQEYQTLSAESEYAGWLSIWGMRANHFTVSVNHLSSFDDLIQLNQWVCDQGLVLNESGGTIKGTPEGGLRQSSTLADRCTVRFACGTEVLIPGCFYEFAQRSCRVGDSTLFQGFVTQNADRIFESTHQ